MIDLDDDSVVISTERTKWLDSVTTANLKTDCKTHRQYRLFGQVFKYNDHRIEFYSNKKKAQATFNHLCPKFDPTTGKLDRKFGPEHPLAGQFVPCAMCDELGKKPTDRYLVHAIDRVLQRAGQPNPVVVLRLPTAAMVTIYNKKEFNRGPDGKKYSAAHSQFGFDIHLKFDPDAQAALMYQIETAQLVQTPLTPQEQAYPTNDFQKLYQTLGFLEADPTELRTFLERVKMVPPRTGAPAGVSMPTSFDDEGPAMGHGANFGGAPSSFQPPTGFPAQPQGGFQPPAGFPAQQPFQPPQAGFQPPTTVSMPTVDAQPSPRFSPQADQPAPGGDTPPSCFKVPEALFTKPDCQTCKFLKACAAG